DGRWYWQYRSRDDDWSEAQSFLITGDTGDWDPPSGDSFVKSVPSYHRRVLVDKRSLSTFRALSRNPADAERLISLADRVMGEPPPYEDEGLRTIDADSSEKIDKLEKDAAKSIGQELFKVVDRLCKAYVLTGNPRYAEQAIEWALEGASWDPAGVTRIND